MQSKNFSQVPRIWIGIDPGVNTGLCVWDRTENKIILIVTTGIIAAMEIVKTYAAEIKDLIVVFEDAKMRKIFESKQDKALPADKRLKKANARLQGAGSIKRDSSIWEEFLIYNQIKFQKQAPRARLNEVAEDEVLWQKYSNYKKRTSEHARCASMLVLNR